MTIRSPGPGKSLRAASALFGVCIVAGCASVDVPTTVDVTGMPNAELALQKSMQEVDAEMSRVGRFQPHVTPATLPVVVPGELDRVISFEWNGPLDEAIAALARTVGYTVAVRAPENAAPLMITVARGPQRVYDILQQLGDDAGAQATVSVDPQHHILEVIHHV